jgi:acetoin utilization deacetylase AcuC-like enzyme
MTFFRMLPCIFDSRYCTTAAHTISTTKQVEVVRAALHEELLDLRPWTFNEARAWADVERAHEPAYVQAVRSGRPRSLAESQGFTWSPAFAGSVARIWAGHVYACRLALAEGIVFHPVSGAHHARRGHGAGFCTFNFLVGAGLAMLDDRRVGRVAIVDLDAHQGDGTRALVGDDPRFGLFDIAGEDWMGEAEGDRATLSVVRSAERYMAALSRLPEFLDRFEPGLVQYQAGMDCHEHDPVAGIAGVDAAFLARRDRFVIGEVARRGIPLVVNLAGGYQSDGTTVALHVETARIAAEAYCGLADDRCSLRSARLTPHGLAPNPGTGRYGGLDMDLACHTPRLPCRHEPPNHR